MNETSEQALSALAQTVNGLEAGRRVGWARAYEAADGKESAERDLNVARGNLALIEKFTALMYGAVLAATPGLAHLLTKEQPGIAAMLPQRYVNKGRALGTDFLEVDPELRQREQDRAEAAQRKASAAKQVGKQSDRLWRNAKQSALNKFAQDEMREWLSLHRTAPDN
jgi:hypothetical protein